MYLFLVTSLIFVYKFSKYIIIYLCLYFDNMIYIYIYIYIYRWAIATINAHMYIHSHLIGPVNIEAPK